MVAAGITVAARTGGRSLPVAVAAAEVVSLLVAHGVSFVDGLYVADVARVTRGIERFGRPLGLVFVSQAGRGAFVAITVDQQCDRVCAASFAGGGDRGQGGVVSQAQGIKQGVVDNGICRIDLDDADETVRELVEQLRFFKNHVHLVDCIVRKFLDGVAALPIGAFGPGFRTLVEGDKNVDNCLLFGEGKGAGGCEQAGRAAAAIAPA